MKRITVSLICAFLCFCYNSNAQKTNNTNDVYGGRSVNPMVHPQISSPSNQSDVFIDHPVFIWTPPPISGGVMVTYSIRLVQVLSGQTPEEALLQNPPLLNLVGLNNTFLTYPPDAPPLENNAQYAWQVAANSGGKSLGAAEIGLFNIKKPDKKRAEEGKLTTTNDNKNKQNTDSTPKPTKNTPNANVAQKPQNKSNTDFDVYPVATEVSDGHFYVTKGIVRFAYINKANDTKLNYSIKCLDKNENLNSLPEVQINHGTNKLEINLQHNGLEENKYYDLEITDSKGHVYKLVYYYINQ